MKNKIDQSWILLIHQLPPKPTNLRVRIWRKLQKLGAIVIKNSVYVLPFNDKTHEDFQWLKQEIESAGGDALVFRAGAVEGATDEEIISGFRKARDEEYELVAADLDGLTGTINEQKRGGHFSAGRVAGYEAELERLHKDLERAVAIDFFDAPGRLIAVRAYERCLAALRATQSRSERLAKTRSKKSAELDLRQYQGQRWVTRRNLFIDRLASIWLIKQFIDKRPRFYFVSEGETVEGGIRFDMYGAEFTHRGEDCTFETMVNRFGLGDNAALKEIAEIVHDIDLKDNKFNRLEAPGLSAVIKGLAEILKDDRKLFQQCNPIFDGLYESFNQEAKQAAKKRPRERQTRDRARSRKKQSRRE
jgi:hypothetical protein